jgi:release factor glutamine methyltransferase
MESEDLQSLKAEVAAVIAKEAGASTEAEAQRILEATGAMPAEERRTLALAWAGKRAQGAPLGLVIGKQRFLGIDLLTREDVLAAREETEIVGNEVLAILRALFEADPKRELRMIDMGCGSGNLACAAAMAIPQVKVWASDITESCASLTRANVTHLALEKKIQVSQGDLFAPLVGRGLEGTMDLVVMNPPYIPSTSLASSHAGLLRHEPKEAFDGGPYGISILTRLLQEAPPFLKAGGNLLFEFGLGQAKIVKSLVERKNLYAGFRFANDAQGEPRAAVLTR